MGDGTTTSTNKPEEIATNGVTAIAAGRHHSLFLKDGNLWDMGWNTYGQLGDGTINNTNRPELIVIGTPGYNLISARLVNDGSGRMSLPFVGLAGVNYALDRSLSLAPPNWIPQVTNSAGAGGVLVFTNAPNAATNNYWRIRSVP